MGDGRGQMGDNCYIRSTGIERERGATIAQPPCAILCLASDTFPQVRVGDGASSMRAAHDPHAIRRKPLPQRAHAFTTLCDAVGELGTRALESGAGPPVDRVAAEQDAAEEVRGA